MDARLVAVSCRRKAHNLSDVPHGVSQVLQHIPPFINKKLPQYKVILVWRPETHVAPDYNTRHDITLHEASH